jgi:hypothetical protein
MWQRECKLYQAKQFDTDEVAEYVADVVAMNLERSTEPLQ